jgi:hypothetical protein
MNVIGAAAPSSAVLTNSACSGSSDTLVVHIPYTAVPQIISNAISANFEICREDEENTSR